MAVSFLPLKRIRLVLITKSLDITASNLLFKVAAIDQWSEDEVFVRLGQPQRDPIRTISGSEPGASAPRYLVESNSLIDPRFLTEDIMLVDFGQSFSFPCDDRPREDIGIPFSCCAPEILFDSIMDKYSEIWALGCVIYEIRAGQQLFSTWFGGRDETLRQMVQTLGKLPDQWWNTWSERTSFFSDDGKPKTEWNDGQPLAVEYPMGEMIADIGTEDWQNVEPRKAEAMLEPIGATVPYEEALHLKDLLDGILKWSPEERTSLEEILHHPWITTAYER